MKLDAIKNYQNFKIYFTFFLFWLSIQFEKPIEDSIAFVLVITIGIVHGANDLLIISLKETNKNVYRNNLFIYLSIVFFKKFYWNFLLKDYK